MTHRNVSFRKLSVCVNIIEVFGHKKLLFILTASFALFGSLPAWEIRLKNSGLSKH